MVTWQWRVLVFAAAIVATEASATCVRPITVHISNSAMRPPYDSGVVSVWTRVVGDDSRNRRQELHLLYFGHTQVLPKQGQVCHICYHIGVVDGLVYRTGAHVRHAKIVDEISCS